MPDWPHQTYAVSEADRLLKAGELAICITSPTGGGKSKIVHRLIERGQETLVLCNRTFLFEQWARGLDENGLPYGMVASGYAPSIFENCQLGMVQTIYRRWKRGEPLPDVKLVVLDEAHNEKGYRMQEMLAEFRQRGIPVIFITATPVGLKGMADVLVVAGKPSELFKLGALVPAHTYAPDEPDMKSFKGQTRGIIQFKDECKEVMMRVIFGRVIEHYHQLNPEQTPSILFAPGVDESRWLTEQFNDRGVPWSHIDGERIILNGHSLAATRENRDRLLLASRTGETKGISNRFVMREGIDAPWLEHGILACTFGSVASYLQAGGRLLRQHFVDGVPQLKHVTIQDHGGNFWRHDSLNADRDWSLDDTGKSIREKHDAKLREKEEAEPIVCPKCGKVRTKGVECPACGFVAKGKRRIVVQTDGTLREVRGDIFKPRRVSETPSAHKLWLQCYWRCRKAGKTFSQARGLYIRESRGCVPGPDFPMTPAHASDWALPISSVPTNRYK